MRIGVPREIKNSEFRVAITPSGVHDLTAGGHTVQVERGAGEGSGIPDALYAEAGARLADTAEQVWTEAELVLKVKEPIEPEFRWFREDLALFTYLHLAAARDLTRALLDSGMTAIAYETVQLPDRSLPLLAPMSQVAGRLAPIVGQSTMLTPNGGPGLLVPGVPGTRPAKVVVLGGGVAGTNSVRMAVGLGADVTVLDTNPARLVDLDSFYAGRITTTASNAYEIERALRDADLVVGAVLLPGARTPALVSNELISRMRPGSVLVDISIDQGGCFEDSHPTTHEDPTFPVHGSLLYCVANMPGAVPHTATYALTNATLPYVRAIARLGWREAMTADPALARGLNVSAGMLASEPVAAAHGLRCVPLETALAA